MEACPKCGKRFDGLAIAEECPFCGVVFARFRQNPPPRLAAHRRAQPPPPRSPIAARNRSGFWDRAGDLAARHRDQTADWAKGRFAVLYAIPLLAMGYFAVRYSLDATYVSVFDGINLAIHEAGHLLFRFFGTFIMIAGGTALQLMAPLGCCVYFYRRPDYFGVAFSGFWLAANCYHVATYVADARAQILPLVTVGGGVPIHDWNYLLSTLGLLDLDGTLAWMIRAAGFTIMWASIAYGAWLVRRIAVSAPSLPH